MSIIEVDIAWLRLLRQANVVVAIIGFWDDG
jgi:hypothetical protein